MLMLLSPSKTLDYTQNGPNSCATQPQHLDHAAQLVQQLSQYTPAQLAQLMKVSDALAGLNAARYGQWGTPFTCDNARPAIFAFQGDVYGGLQADQFDEAALAFAQQHLRILSGLYGLLRPLDLMQAYRLEMGTALASPRGKDLYAFWGEHITEWLNEELTQQNESFVLNLASNEYMRAVRRHALKAQVIDVVFRDYKAGQYKVISLYAKRARGLMARHVIQNRLHHPDQLHDFNSEGYCYSPQHSNLEQQVFLRD